MIEMSNPINNVTPDKNGYPFEKWLYYANRGGFLHCYYVGKKLAYGCEEDDYIYPDGLEADIPNAIQYLEYASDHNIHEACFLLGIIYMGSFDSDYANEAEAFKYIKKSAELGNTNAQHLCGVLYETGGAGYVDEDLAYHWYVESAYHSNPRAEVDLSKHYRYKALEYPEDMSDEELDEFWYYVSLSFLWAHLAADDGSDEGMYLTGLHYYDGFGVDENMEKAKEYLIMASENGNEDAQKFLAEKFKEGE